LHRLVRLLRGATGYPTTLAAIASVAGALAFWLAIPTSLPEPAPSRSSTAAPAQATVLHADFGSEAPRPVALFMANWIVRNNDAGGSGFAIIDKVAAHMYVFGADGRLRGAAPVLLGSAIGDDTVPGIGNRPLSDVRPYERTTPAGRFVGEPGHNARGEDVVWVDYDAAVSIHRVITSNRSERRLERLRTPTPDDNRISYGCINVPRDFYETHVQPTFRDRHAVVYILPEVHALPEVFALQRDVH
jgi:hypothetical protein